MRLPSHVYRAAGGVYYFRFVFPPALRQTVGRREIRRSLRTHDIKQARTRAFEFFLALEKALGRCGMPGFNPDDIGKFELDYSPTKGIRLKTDPNNPQDAADALKALAALQNTLQATSNQTLRPAPEKHLLGPEIVKYLTLHGEKWQPKTREEYRLILNRFAAYFPRRSVESITKADMVGFIEHLSSNNTGIAARDKNIGTIRGFFEHAAAIGIYPNGPLPTDAIKGLTKRAKSSLALRNGWLMFDDDELRALFASANVSRLKKPHEFFLPALGLLSGARIGELCQLYVSDIRRVPDGTGKMVDVINISNAEPGQTVKSAAAVRQIPIHPILVNIGFLDYVKDVATLYGPRSMLFPYLRPGNVNGFSDVPSEAFGRYRKHCGITRQRVVFHSFRKNANNTLKQNGVSEEIRCQLLGQEYDSVNSRVYSEGLGLSSLYVIVCRHLTYPVDFSHLRYSPAIRDKLIAEMERREKHNANADAREKRIARNKRAAARKRPAKDKLAG